MSPNKIRIEELKQADHIYTWRFIKVYSHHGIYVGDHKVIHFTGSANFSSSSSSSSSHMSVCSPCQHCRDTLSQLPTHQTQAPSQGGVIISCLDTFLNGGDLYRYDYSMSATDFIVHSACGTGTTASSDPDNEVLHRANVLLDTNGFGAYNLFKNNCEDFAIYCKTSHVEKSYTTVSRSGQIHGLLLNLGGILGHFVFRPIYCYLSDVGVDRDFVKVSVEKLVEHTCS
ncbi:hypothetical protein LUZ63_017397 [Rhynchospora breviuscula]|uniref:LRAT domain-containing protein n=1 Tax=Rhynchospora breviuscula TaxID=2022672 RepID=A0A9Q0HFP8_9POAL|nr:hypothetical protein LUZ63_017397 [Rhynchospora breviuscula]